MKLIKMTLGVSLALGGAAWAHQGVQNAAVMARMNSMSAIADSVKVIGTMARGTLEFDATAARLAATEIAAQAARTPALFRAPEDDPKSEARAAIWTDFEDFVEKSNTLETLALDLSQTISAPSDLAPALTRLADSCKACHGDYRD